MRLVKHSFFLVNPHWVLLITSFSSTCLEVTSRISCSITFPGIRWDWLACSFTAPPSCPFWSLEWLLSSEISSLLSDLSKMMRAVWQSLLPPLLVLVGASHSDLWICVCHVCLYDLCLNPPWPEERGRSSFPQTVSLISSVGFPVWDSQEAVLTVKTEAKKGAH